MNHICTYCIIPISIKLNMDSYLQTNQLGNEERKIAALPFKYATDVVIYGYYLYIIYTLYDILYYM